MAHRVLTETAVSISEHKKNPMATVAAGEGMAVAVLNRNEPAFYWPLSGDNEVGRRFASTNCYQERLSLGNTAVSSPRAGA